MLLLKHKIEIFATLFILLLITIIALVKFNSHQTRDTWLNPSPSTVTSTTNEQVVNSALIYEIKSQAIAGACSALKNVPVVDLSNDQALYYVGDKLPYNDKTLKPYLIRAITSRLNTEGKKILDFGHFVWRGEKSGLNG